MAAKEAKPKKEKSGLSPFDIINNICEGPRGTNLFAESKADISGNNIDSTSIDKSYVSFIINRGFSNFQDTALLANEMNKYASFLTPKMQYDFLRNIIRPRKRFAKWGKAGDNTSDVNMLMELYSYSSEKARDALTLLTEDQLIILRKRASHGGSS